MIEEINHKPSSLTWDIFRAILGDIRDKKQRADVNQKEKKREYLCSHFLAVSQE